MNLALHLGWYNAWRAQVQNAKDHPEVQDAYCRAALIAQTQYECYRALYWAQMRVK